MDDAMESFNRTRLECKCGKGTTTEADRLTFNRTRLECKFSFLSPQK